MANDGTYTYGPVPVFNNGVVQQNCIVDVVLTGGSGTATLFVEASGDYSMSEAIDITEHTGQPSYDVGPGEHQRFVLIFDKNIMSAFKYIRPTIILDTGGANDGDYTIDVRRS